MSPLFRIKGIISKLESCYLVERCFVLDEDMKNPSRSNMTYLLEIRDSIIIRIVTNL